MQIPQVSNGNREPKFDRAYTYIDRDDEEEPNPVEDIDPASLIFTPYYDILIEVHHNAGGTYQTTTLRGYSGALISASSVWRRILDPNTRFAHPKEQIDDMSGRSLPLITIDELSGIKGAIYLFDIIHHRGDRIPFKINFKEFADIALIADQFDCAGAVQIYANEWTWGLPRRTHRPRVDYLDWILITNVFRNIASLSVPASEHVRVTAIVIAQVINLSLHSRLANGSNEDDICWEVQYQWLSCSWLPDIRFKTRPFVEVDVTRVPGLWMSMQSAFP